MLGCAVDFCTLELTGGTISSRMAFAYNSPLFSVSLHWIVGTVFLVPAVLIHSELQHLLHPDVLPPFIKKRNKDKKVMVMNVSKEIARRRFPKAPGKGDSEEAGSGGGTVSTEVSADNADVSGSLFEGGHSSSDNTNPGEVGMGSKSALSAADDRSAEVKLPTPSPNIAPNLAQPVQLPLRPQPIELDDEPVSMLSDMASCSISNYLSLTALSLFFYLPLTLCCIYVPFSLGHKLLGTDPLVLNIGDDEAAVEVQLPMEQLMFHVLLPLAFERVKIKMHLWSALEVIMPSITFGSLLYNFYVCCVSLLEVLDCFDLPLLGFYKVVSQSCSSSQTSQLDGSRRRD